MDLAKQLLNLSSNQIKEIAFQCGFNSLSTFSRKFKHEYGCSPSKYRKNCIKSETKLINWNLPFTEKYFNQLVLIKNKNSWLKNLFSIVIDNLDNESFSIEDLSKQLFMSSSNLNRKIKKIFGFSTLKLIRDLRLQHAAELLNTQNISVTEVTYLTGFYDAAHLSRYFKTVFGCSPGEYRNIYPFFKCLESLKDIEISKNVK